MYGFNASGSAIIPSDSWYVSMIAAIVLGSAGLGPPRRRVRHVLQRQLVAIQDLFAVEVRDRDLSGRYQPEIPILHLEQLVGELGEVRGAYHRSRVDQHRRPQLGVAMLAGVHVEHELNQPALQARTVADQKGKSRTRDTH